MTQEEIREAAAKFDNQIKALHNQIEMLRLQKKQLQAECKHPNQFRYYAMGDPGWHCPDCGHEI